MKRTLLTTAALAIGLGLAVPVLAQPGPGRDGGPGMDRHAARMCEDQDAHLAGMLAFTERKLDITEQQRPAWNKFADTARAGLKPMQDLCARIKDQPRPTALPQRVERMEAMMSARLQQIQQVRPALNDLYAQLSPEQQRTADGLLRQAMRHGFGGHHGKRFEKHHGGMQHDRRGPAAEQPNEQPGGQRSE
jgi:NADH pyrophosphatase NudC (nudix superfamily)